jgi:hypothetical protein
MPTKTVRRESNVNPDLDPRALLTEIGESYRKMGAQAREEVRQRRRLRRETGSDVAGIIAAVATVSVGGNVCIPKPALVAALGRYFGETGVGHYRFIERAYGPLQAGETGVRS